MSMIKRSIVKKSIELIENSVTCPKCGENIVYNNSQIKFCPFCGEKIISDETENNTGK